MGSVSLDEQALDRAFMQILTMRVHTPSGEWLPTEFEDHYFALIRELVESDDTAEEYLFLSSLNLNRWLVDLLVEHTGVPAEQWLQVIARDAIGLTD